MQHETCVLGKANKNIQNSDQRTEPFLYHFGVLNMHCFGFICVSKVTEIEGSVLYIKNQFFGAIFFLFLVGYTSKESLENSIMKANIRIKLRHFLNSQHKKKIALDYKVQYKRLNFLVTHCIVHERRLWWYNG